MSYEIRNTIAPRITEGWVLLDIWNRPIGNVFNSLDEFVASYNIGMLEQSNYKVRKFVKTDYDISSIQEKKEID